MAKDEPFDRLEQILSALSRCGFVCLVASHSSGAWLLKFGNPETGYEVTGDVADLETEGLAWFRREYSMMVARRNRELGHSRFRLVR